MPDSDLAERLDAVERALTDDDADLTDVRDAATLAGDVQRLERQLQDLEATVDELEAAVEAVRGYAGNVRAVNRDVERRASAALAKAEAIEASIGPVADADVAANDSQVARQPAHHDGSSPAHDETAGEPTGPSRSGSSGRGHDGAERDGIGANSTVPRRDGMARSDREEPTRDTGQSSKRRDPGVDSADDTGCGQGAASDGTEQFIERVRDAL